MKVKIIATCITDCTPEELADLQNVTAGGLETAFETLRDAVETSSEEQVVQVFPVGDDGNPITQPSKNEQQAAAGLTTSVADQEEAAKRNLENGEPK